MKKNEQWQLAVVGAGASGLIAAVRAAQEMKKAGQPVSVLVLEGSAKPGRKLLATGNGKCNLTNMNAAPASYFGSRGASRVLQAVSPARVRSYFQALGLLTKEDDMGRVYPVNEQASAVLGCLLNACEELGVEVRCGGAVTALQREKNGFSIKLSTGETLCAARVLLACGGKAAPNLGCGDNAPNLARSLGHTVTERTPALVRLLAPEVPAALKGVRTKAAVTLQLENAPAVSSEGEVIFGAGSVSGICVMQLSRAVAAQKGKTALVLDLLPEMEEGALRGFLLCLCEEHPLLPAARILDGVLPGKLNTEVLRRCGVKTDGLCREIPRKQLASLAHGCKAFALKITGTGDWADAQVTAGGVPLTELSLPQMASRCCPGLFITGELCDVDGDCGGYTLHWAWATGLLAGEAAAR